MYRIVKKRPLNEEVTLMAVCAPDIAKKALPGQFVILRTDEEGERIPLTIAEADSAAGEVTVIYQKVGASTHALDLLCENDSLADLAGPLGRPSHLDGIKKCAVVGGGLGCAIAWPVARALHRMGAEVDMIAGFRSGGLVILEEEMRASSTRLHVCTDDGSRGEKGFVTDKLKSLIDSGSSFDTVFAVGPLVMMKFVSRLTERYGIPTVVSMNPIMLDGTGMCGCCRVTVGGKVKFACVDGPEFDGHQVDFDEAMARNATYRDFEKRHLEEHLCRLTGGARNG